ncbi:MAG: hypothetical protein QOJ26_1132 [Thermoplasmata archaeon]|jgi:hypothetical protein|nr:hypothetical protein [Thermoplasmata archaeon]
MVASRAARELQALNAVEVARRGSLVAIRLDEGTPAGAFLATVTVPDPPF